jgi:hypothetical protein
MKHEHAIEELHHFQCGKCKKWWTIGDAPKAKKNWFCPWCGSAGGGVKKSLKNKIIK